MLRVNSLHVTLFAITLSASLFACSQPSDSTSGDADAPDLAEPATSSEPHEIEAPASNQDQFFAALTAQCGKRFNGKMVSTDPADTERFSGPMQMHVRDCNDSEIRIPFSVGEDHSRTWVISRTGQGLRLKHDHRHEDGSEDILSQYGGDTAGEGSATRQEFPVDEFSKQLFEAQSLNVSMTNVWAVEMIPGQLFAYELKRENRFFRVEFPLDELAESDAQPAE